MSKVLCIIVYGLLFCLELGCVFSIWIPCQARGRNGRCSSEVTIENGMISGVWANAPTLSPRSRVPGDLIPTSLRPGKDWTSVP